MYKNKLSQHALILVTIFKLSGGTTAPVAFEDIVIQVWKDFPEIFSLRGHPEFPDSNNVSKRLYSTLLKNGWIVSLKGHVVRLTEKGIAEAERLLSLPHQSVGYSPLRNLPLSQEERRFLEQAFRSRTFAAWLEGKKESLVDYDARVFFGFSSTTPYAERQRRLEIARSAIGKAVAASLPGATALESLATYLVERFSVLLMGE